MWHELAIAFCLMLVLEGLLPFAAPRRWKAMLTAVSMADDRQLRLAGLTSMLAGVILLYLIN
ncbi:MAG: DUF2065 domain-containing protein [Pseudomonadota bacterium]